MSKITDQELLDMICRDLITIDPDGNVIKYHQRRKKFYKISPQQNHRKRFRLNIGVGPSNQRTIVRSKLIWMIVNRQVVPDGMDVHHKDYDRTNDSPDNLVLRDTTANRADNQIEEYFNKIVAKRSGSKGDF